MAQGEESAPPKEGRTEDGGGRGGGRGTTWRVYSKSLEPRKELEGAKEREGETRAGRDERKEKREKQLRKRAVEIMKNSKIKIITWNM